ncbi:MAG: hypothetical protein H6708_19595 [Kofleriaceae bacterium]|nr:hypothetical protein [Kofleriaceae bacterium]
MSRVDGPRPARRWSPQRGAALSLMLILITALLAGGALAMYLQLADTKAAKFLSESRGSLFCAEAGLAASRSYVATHATDWPAMLDGDTSNDPDGYPIEGDLDGDGVMDYHVEVRDNDDELPPATNDPSLDTDATVFVVSTCLRYPDTPREVLEMISFSGSGFNYRNQSGQGAGGTNNAN